MEKKDSIDNIWYTIQEETERRVNAEPVLASFFHTTVLEHSSFSFMKARSSQFDEHIVFNKCKSRMGLSEHVQNKAEKVNKGQQGAGGSEMTADHHQQLEAQWRNVFGKATGLNSYQELWQELSPLSL